MTEHDGSKNDESKNDESRSETSAEADQSNSGESDSGHSMYDDSSGLLEGENGASTSEDSTENAVRSERSEYSEDTEQSESEDPPESALGEGKAPENRMQGMGFDEPLVSSGGGEPEQSTGTFYVKHVEDAATTLHEIHTSQVFVVIENPGLEPGEILEATLVAQPPMEVSYLFNEIVSRRTIPVELSDLEPTNQVRDITGRMDVGEAVAIDREGEGEIHILTVEPGQASERAEEVREDETTHKNAGRYEVDRVEIRTAEDDGIVSIRYLPD